MIARHIKTVSTGFAVIYIAGDHREALRACRGFCERGLCVNVSPTEYIYTYGQESGVRVELINYPRFPKKQSDINAIACELADTLCSALSQGSYTIVTPAETSFFSRRAQDA